MCVPLGVNRLGSCKGFKPRVCSQPESTSDPEMCDKLPLNPTEPSANSRFFSDQPDRALGWEAILIKI